MFFGDIVTMTPTGVVVREKALQPLGIYDQSVCWGVWAANPHPHHQHYRHPHLIISPFHPSSWPFLIRLRILLENRKGALAEAARLLEKNDLSIIFAECIPTGFTNVTWTVIAESTKDELDNLRAKKERFDKETPAVRAPPDKSFRKARTLANEIAAHMLGHVRTLEGVFEEVASAQQARAAKSDDPPLLHVWDAQSDEHFLYNENDVAREMEKMKCGPLEANLGYVRSHIPRPAEITYLQRMAYFSVYGGGKYDEVPFKFQYKADATLMERQSDVPFDEGSFKLTPLPMIAFGVFNSEDKYLRLCPAAPPFLKRPLTRISVRYEVQQPKHNAKASKGLLRRVCDGLRDDVNILYTSNKWTKHGYANEEGEISFIADLDHEDYTKVEEKLKAINDEGRPDRLSDVIIKAAYVSKYAERRLFLSTHFGHPRQDCITQMVRQAAINEGFVSVFVNEHTEPVTQVINEEMHKCQAFLQIIYLTNGDPSRKINLDWLISEYSMALSIGIPRLRLVDVSKNDSEWWSRRLPVDRDEPLQEFRIDLSDADLREQIRSAVKEITGTPRRES